MLTSPKIGMICRHTRPSGFKLAIVVGGSNVTSARAGRIRVCVWRAASACWTKPQLVDADTLALLTKEEHTYRATLIKTASKSAVREKLATHVSAPARDTPPKHYFVIAKNTDGRACAWGKAPTLEAAKEIADRMWAKHGDNGACYPGEKRARDGVSRVDADPTDSREGEAL